MNISEQLDQFLAASAPKKVVENIPLTNINIEEYSNDYDAIVALFNEKDGIFFFNPLSIPDEDIDRICSYNKSFHVSASDFKIMEDYNWTAYFQSLSVQSGIPEELLGIGISNLQRIALSNYF